MSEEEKKVSFTLQEIYMMHKELGDSSYARLVKDELCPRDPKNLFFEEVVQIAYQNAKNDKGQQLRDLLYFMLITSKR